MAGTINVGTIQVGGLAELKKQLRDIKSEMLSATDPERMRELAEAAGELKDRIGDANEQVKVFASGSKFEQVSNSFGSLKDSLMSLDFEEASDKAKVFQKTVTSISPETISTGIKGLASTVATLGKTFVQFGVMLLTNPIFLLVAAITAIVVAIGALMNSLGLLKPIINAVGNFFKGLMSIINSVVDGIKSALDWVGLTDFAGQELAKKQEQRTKEEIDRNWKLKQAKKELIEQAYNKEQTALQRSIDLQKAQGKETTELEKKKIQASINYQKEKLKEIELEIQDLELMKQQGDDWGEFDKFLTEIRIEDAKKLKDEIAGTENELKILDANAKREAQQRAEKAAEKQKEIRDREREAKKNAIEEIRQLENEYRRSQLTEQERELEDIKIKYEEQIKAAKKYGVDTKTLEANYAAEKAAVVKKYEDEAKKLKDEKDAQDLIDQEEANQKRIELEDQLFNLQRELDYKKLSEREANKQKEIDALTKEYEDKYLLAVNNAELTKQLKEQEDAEIRAIDDKYKKEQEKADEEARQKKIQATIDTGNQIADWTKQGLTAINDIVSAFAGESEKQQEKAFKIQKATNIAMAVIDTLKGGVSAYMSQIVAGDPTSVVRGAIAAAMVVAAGIANVKKIASTQFKGASVSGASGGAGASGGGGVQPATPQTNLFGQNNNMNTLQGAQSVESQPQVIKAVVVESDITTSQSRVKRMEENATL
jgi:myosin heavy subunit